MTKKIYRITVGFPHDEPIPIPKSPIDAAQAVWAQFINSPMRINRHYTKCVIYNTLLEIPGVVDVFIKSVPPYYFGGMIKVDGCRELLYLDANSDY